jgi:predicted transcriptional regulator
MSDTKDRLTDELAGSALGLIPVIGPLLTPFGKLASKNVREEWERNHSKALRAAERISGMSREELADNISEDPRLIPLAIRVLYAAGMTGQDVILRALGTALGEAVIDREKIDEAEMLLIGLADLRKQHIAILEIMSAEVPGSTPENPHYWHSQLLAETSGFTRDLVNVYLSGLVRSGLIRQVDNAYGICYEITQLGRTALEVLNELADDPQPS